MRTIEQSCEAGRKAGAAEAQRIIGAHLNRQNVDTLAQLARKIPEARREALNEPNEINREFWLAYLDAIEPAVVLSQGAA